MVCFGLPGAYATGLCSFAALRLLRGLAAACGVRECIYETTFKSAMDVGARWSRFPGISDRHQEDEFFLAAVELD